MEIINNIWSFLSPLIASLLTYFVLIKGKRKDIDHEKEKKLNAVVSNLLDIWDYLKKMEKLTQLDKFDNFLPFSSDTMKTIFLNSKMTDDKCFQELEKSILYLKEYTPLTYIKLSGLGSNFEEIKNSLIIPPIKSGNEILNKVTRDNVKEKIKDIEEITISISKYLGRSFARKIKKQFNSPFYQGFEDFKNDYHKRFYEYMIPFISQGEDIPTFEEFKIELDKTENIQSIQKMTNVLIGKSDVSSLKNLMSTLLHSAENPPKEFDELFKDLKSSESINQKKGDD